MSSRSVPLFGTGEALVRCAIDYMRSGYEVRDSCIHLIGVGEDKRSSIIIRIARRHLGQFGSHKNNRT